MSKFLDQIIKATLPGKVQDNALLLCAQIAQKRLTPPRQVKIDEQSVTFLFSGASITVTDHYILEVPEYSPARVLDLLGVLRGDK